jgi:hypothetical protein
VSQSPLGVLAGVVKVASSTLPHDPTATARIAQVSFEKVKATLKVMLAVFVVIAIGVGITAAVQSPPPGPVLVGLPQGTVGSSSGRGQEIIGVPFTFEWTTRANIKLLRIEAIPVRGYLTPELDCAACGGLRAGPILGRTFDRAKGSMFEFVPDWRMRNRPGSIEAIGGIRVVYEYKGTVISLPIIGGAWMCWSSPSYRCASHVPSL